MRLRRWGPSAGGLLAVLMMAAMAQAAPRRPAPQLSGEVALTRGVWNCSWGLRQYRLQADGIQETLRSFDPSDTLRPVPLHRRTGPGRYRSIDPASNNTPTTETVITNRAVETQVLLRDGGVAYRWRSAQVEGDRLLFVEYNVGEYDNHVESECTRITEAEVPAAMAAGAARLWAEQAPERARREPLGSLTRGAWRCERALVRFRMNGEDVEQTVTPLDGSREEARRWVFTPTGDGRYRLSAEADGSRPGASGDVSAEGDVYLSHDDADGRRLRSRWRISGDLINLAEGVDRGPNAFSTCRRIADTEAEVASAGPLKG